jgi:hypothetical protein
MFKSFSGRLRVAIFSAILLTNSAQAADWTVLIYMNGKNNLEKDALDNFHDIAKIGGTSSVNFVVELGRPASHYTSADGGWSGVKRFLITAGTQPVESAALEDLEQNGESTDMGSADTLSRFIGWGVSKFPASRYMLIVWNHGQGWRFQLAQNRQLRAVASQGDTRSADRTALPQVRNSVQPVGGFRSVSTDEDTGNTIYNSDIQAVLENKFQSRKLELLGFDACLMGMIETGYAFRNAANVLVASEELEPGAGWPYDLWVRNLVDHPQMDEKELAHTLISTYQQRYADSDLTTLSAVDLDKVASASRAISGLSQLMLDRVATEGRVIGAARAKVTPYGKAAALKTSIDFDYFLEQYRARTSDADIRISVDTARTALAAIVLQNYASELSKPKYGSRGVAIYFPANRSDFLADPYSGGYDKNNANHPVEFVTKEKWSDFIDAYLQ